MTVQPTPSLPALDDAPLYSLRSPVDEQKPIPICGIASAPDEKGAGLRPTAWDVRSAPTKQVPGFVPPHWGVLVSQLSFAPDDTGAGFSPFPQGALDAFGSNLSTEPSRSQASGCDPDPSYR